MNILLVTQEDYLAGSTYSVSYLAKGLAQRGHRVVVAARAGSLLLTLFTGSNVVPIAVNIRSRTDWRAILKLRAIVDEFEIEIINAQSSYDRYTSVFVKWLFRRRLKVVHTRRQISMSVGGWLQNWVYVNGTEKIIAVSEQVKSSLIKQGFPEKHVDVIHNGTPADKYKHIDLTKVSALRNRLGIREDDIVIGCISRKKFQSQLLHALHQLDRPVVLILVGVSFDGELKRLAENAPTRHRIFFEGHVESKEAVHYYPLFTINALCSITEGLSQSLLEAMYLKVPVVATAAAGNLDLISHGDNGLLFEHGNITDLARKLCFLMDDKELRSRLAQNAFKTVTLHFSMDRVINQYEGLWMSLLYHSHYKGVSLYPPVPAP